MVEVISGRPRLVVCGAGHDAVPLVRLASELGFEVTVVDDRRQFLSRERFPEATTLVHCAPADLATHVSMDPEYCSGDHVAQLPPRRRLSGVSARAPGRLHRLSRARGTTRANAQGSGGGGQVVEQEDLERIHGPAGIDLGADGPTEIAWSVLSEILAVRRGAGAGFLVDRKGPSELRRLP